MWAGHRLSRLCNRWGFGRLQCKSLLVVMHDMNSGLDKSPPASPPSEEDWKAYQSYIASIKVVKPWRECNWPEKSDRIADFGMALFISTVVPLVPVGISAITESLTNTIWMQSICIYLFLVGAASKSKAFRYLSFLGGVGTSVIYGMLEGTVPWVIDNQDFLLQLSLGWAIGMSVSNISLAWKDHLQDGKPAVGGSD